MSRNRMYICSECGQETTGLKHKCPSCGVSGDNLIEKLWGIADYEYIDESGISYEYDVDVDDIVESMD